MKIFIFDELESTQTYGLLLKDELPFCVAAKSQTQGRGQGQHSWQSPEGGLYLSFYLPESYQNLIPVHHIPLHICSLVCLWMVDIFGLEIQIKWPNDLIYKGKKLGGILCQWSSGKIVIGLGINVLKTPFVLPYESVSLKEILPWIPRWDLEDLLHSLCHFFSINRDQPFSYPSYLKYHLPEGQPWINSKTSKIGIQQPFEVPDFALRLTSEVQPIYTAGHGYRWMYQRYINQRTAPFVLIESQCMMLFDQAYDDKPLFIEDIHDKNLQKWRDLYPDTLGQKEWPIFVLKESFSHGTKVLRNAYLISLDKIFGC